eukprot:Platyproteum_vivax@DN7212_c0_g1_i3.p1
MSKLEMMIVFFVALCGLLARPIDGVRSKVKNDWWAYSCKLGGQTRVENFKGRSWEGQESPMLKKLVRARNLSCSVKDQMYHNLRAIESHAPRKPVLEKTFDMCMNHANERVHHINRVIHGEKTDHSRQLELQEIVKMEDYGELFENMEAESTQCAGEYNPHDIPDEVEAYQELYDMYVDKSVNK